MSWSWLAKGLIRRGRRAVSKEKLKSWQWMVPEVDMVYMTRNYKQHKKELEDEVYWC
jgi:hypothetical protein